MIDRILPSAVVSVEAFDDTIDDTVDAVLFPEEAAVVAGAVEKRRREFFTVRGCARQALGRLGVEPAPILRGERGAPIWPAGIVGSMTHCDGYRAAAVAPAARYAAIGIDAEPHDRLPDGVLNVVGLPGERDRLASLATVRPDVHWDRVLFSAKEAVYKAWWPLTHRWLDFAEADITLDPDPATGTFTARLLVPGPEVGGRSIDTFAGTFLIDSAASDVGAIRNLVVSAVVLPSP